jgi:DoxX-like family
MNIVLWILQILLALLFLFAGGTKLILPTDVLVKMGPPDQVVLPGLFIKFIGLCEVLGALGLILPGLLRRRQELTPLAALGLTIILAGAVIVTIMGPGIGMIAAPLIVGVLCAFVAYGRWKLRPLR